MRESRRGGEKNVSKLFKSDPKKCSKLKDFGKKKIVGGNKKTGCDDESIPVEIDIDAGESTPGVCNSPVKSEYSEEGNGTDLSASSSNTVGNVSQCSGSRSSQFSSVPSKKQVISGIKFQPGIRLEAKDLGNGIWYAVKVVEVDWEEEEILIHFEKWSQRYDEWIPMDSSRLRPVVEPPGGSFVKKISKIFKVGDKVMATWSDSRKYPATVKTVLANDRYEVLFFDGFSKNIKGGRMILLKDEELAKIQELQPGIGPSNDLTRSPIADSNLKINSGSMAATLGTKEERRERKRKINVAELFHFKKRPRLDSPLVQTSTDVGKKSRRGGGGFGSRAKKKNQWAEMSGKSIDSPHFEHVKEHVHSHETLPEKHLDDMKGDAMLPPDSKSREHATKARARNKTDDGEKTAKKARADSLLQRIDDETKLVYTRKLGRKLNLFRDVERKHSSISKKERGFEELDMRKRKKKEGEGDNLKPVRHIDDWEPIGEPAYIVDGTDGPRKSIIVADPRIPPGWTRHTIQRMSGHSAGKWDVFFVCPQGRKFRTRHELRTYYEERGEMFPSEQFDFSLGRRKNKTSIEREGSSSMQAASTGNLTSHSKIGRQPGPSSTVTTLVSTTNENTNDTPVRRVKTLLPRVRPPNIEAVPSSVLHTSSPNDIPEDFSITPEGSVVLGGLKIQKDNDAFRCPKEGCNKNFRKENLLQMHIKHYHPEYNRFVASTPNVADLAYARTVGEPLEELHLRTPRSSLLDKISRFEALRRARAVNVDSGANVTTSPSSAPSEIPAAVTPTSIPSPLSHHAVAPRLLQMGFRQVGDNVLADSTSATEVSDIPVQSCPINMDIEETPQASSHILVPAMRSSAEVTIPLNQTEGNGETVQMPDDLHLPVPPSETLPAIDAKVEEKENDSQLLSPSQTLAGVSHTKSSRLVRRRHMSDFHMEPLMKKRKQDTEDANQTIILATGGNRPTRAESLRREELINCTCGYPEEDGLMIQCDLCLCWQHGLCNNIEHEDHVPEKYVCYICQNPSRERNSKHYLHDQDWLKEGRLPSFSLRSKNTVHLAQCENIFKRSHDLAGSLLQLQNVIHSLRVKVNIAENTDHPKLYLWAHSWEKPGTTCQNQIVGDAVVQQDVKESNEEDPLQNDATLLHADDCDTANLPVELSENTHDSRQVASPHTLSSAPESDVAMSTETEVAMAQDSMQEQHNNVSDLHMKKSEERNEIMSNSDCPQEEANGTKSPHDMGVIDKDSDFVRTEINDPAKLQSSLLQNDLVNSPSVINEAAPLKYSEGATGMFSKKLTPSVPQPEAPIDSAECQLILLDHIENLQQHIEARLAALDTHISGLETMDAYQDHDKETDRRTKESVQMLLRDISALYDIAAFN